jgi:ribosome-binding factor A
MGKFRKDRVADLLREVISSLVLLDIKDPRVQGITITEVQLADDLKSARVYFGCLADGQAETHKTGLVSAGKFIRRRLREELDLKYIPELHFEYDSSFDNFQKINSILKELGSGEQNDQ